MQTCFVVVRYDGVSPGGVEATPASAVVRASLWLGPGLSPLGLMGALGKKHIPGVGPLESLGGPWDRDRWG